MGHPAIRPRVHRLKPVARRRRVASRSRTIAWRTLPREGGRVYRYIDSDNYWRVSVQGAGYIQLIKRVGGTETVVATARATLTSSTELRVMWQGNRHRVWVDQVPVIDATDHALTLVTATKLGLWSKNASSRGTFDDDYGQAL